MNPTSAAVGTGLIVTAGRWSEGQGIELRVVVGTTIVAVALSLLGEANAKFAGQFGLLLFIVALMRYGVPIADGVGLLKRAPATPKTGGAA